MKIVHIEDFFHPDAGYQLNVLSALQAQQGHEIYIVTSELHKLPSNLTKFFGKDDINNRDKLFLELTGVKGIIRLPVMGYYSGRSVYFPGLFRTVNRLSPDIVLIHGNDTLAGILFILRSSKLKYPIILDNHMLEMASMNRFNKLFRVFYRKIVAPKIVNRKIPLIRVVDSPYVEKCLGIPLDKTRLLPLGTNTNYFKPDPKKAKQFRANFSMGENDFIVLYAGKLDVNKGGLFFAEAIQKKIETISGKQIVFVIIGTCTDEYGKRVEQIFSMSENRIIRFPTQTYMDLASFYQAVDLSVFPRQCSLSFFDAQSCGLPVLFEDNEINIQRAQFGNAMTFSPGDIDDFRIKLRGFADMQQEQFYEMKSNARKYVLDNYDYVPISEKFSEMMEEEIKRYEIDHMQK